MWTKLNKCLNNVQFTAYIFRRFHVKAPVFIQRLLQRTEEYSLANMIILAKLVQSRPLSYLRFVSMEGIYGCAHYVFELPVSAPF